MGLWRSPEERDARKAVSDAEKKCRKSRWEGIKELAKELEGRYNSVIAVRHELRKTREKLEEKELENKEKKILGQPEADLKTERDAVTKAEELLKTREELLKIIEKRAKTKYPDIFNFL